jgi:cytochrome P450
VPVQGLAYLGETVFQTRTDVVRNVEPNLNLVLGPGSTFGLQDEDHRRRRKLLVPLFHGKRMRVYELLCEFRLVASSSRPERLHSRGVAFAPSGGGRAVV